MTFPRTTPTTSVDVLSARALSCLYQAARLIGDPEVPVAAIVDRIAALLTGYLADRAAVRIALIGEQSVAGFGYVEQPDNLVAAITLDGANCGEISIHYLAPGSAHEGGPAANRQPGAHGADDQALLHTVAGDLASLLRQRQVIDELKKSLIRQRTAQRVGHLGFWEWDLTTNHWFWSDGIHHIFGADPDELGSRREGFLELVHPEDRALVEERLTATLHAGVELSLDHRITTPTGEVRHVHLQGEVTGSGDSGTPTHMIGTIVDVTERKGLEHQLLQSQKMEAVGRLAGGVAHDFNNILSVVLSFGSFAKDSLTPGSPACEDIDEVLAAAKRAVGLTRQLLAFSRHQVTEPRVISINQHVLSTDKMLRRLLGADIELATIPAEDLWLTRIDPGHLEQILVNLAVNARDAMLGGGKLTIETQNVVLDQAFVSQHQGASPGDHVLLAVSDDGIGMPTEILDYIFEPFFTTKASSEGTGLGLATCYAIVKQAGGSIWVYSEASEGTTVKVYLPRARGEAEPSTTAAPPAAIQGCGERVLVVEDDRAVRAVAVRTLRRLGYNVLEAENGEDAQRLCARHPHAIDLLLTDMVMPRLSGRELVERLSPTHPELRVLYMSGYTDNASLRSNRLPGNARFLQKPFMPSELAVKVRETLDAPTTGQTRARGP